MRITYSTSPFERSHGRKPRGRGLWAFRALFVDGHGQPQQSADLFFAGLYREARQAATAHARQQADAAGATGLTLEALP